MTKKPEIKNICELEYIIKNIYKYIYYRLTYVQCKLNTFYDKFTINGIHVAIFYNFM